MVGHGQDYAVNVAAPQNLTVIAIGLLRAGLFLRVSQARFPNVAHGHELDVILLLLAVLENLEQRLKLHAVADEGDVDTVVGAQHTPRRRDPSGLRPHAGRGKRRGRNRDLPGQEVAACGTVTGHV
ncbi:MAG: hypothetical protein ABSF25_07185 [Bryobacteraceae bacterium]